MSSPQPRRSASDLVSEHMDYQRRQREKDIAGRQKLIDARRSVIQSDIEHIASELRKVEEASVAKLPENIFVEAFLPLLTGEPAPKGISFGTWGGIAGNPYNPVDVIDEAGNVLFRVPAILEHSAFDPTAGFNQQLGLHHVLITAEQMRQSFPPRAEAYMENELTNRKALVKITAKQLENLKALNFIFARYGKPLIEVPGVSKTNSGQEVTSSRNDKGSPLEFDEDDNI